MSALINALVQAGFSEEEAQRIASVAPQQSQTSPLFEEHKPNGLFPAESIPDDSRPDSVYLPPNGVATEQQLSSPFGKAGATNKDMIAYMEQLRTQTLKNLDATLNPNQRAEIKAAVKSQELRGGKTAEEVFKEGMKSRRSKPTAQEQIEALYSQYR